MEKLEAEIRKCSSCHLSNDAEKLASLPGRGRKGKYLIVGLAPSSHRVNLPIHSSVMPFGDKKFTSHLLGRVLEEVGLDDFYLTNLIKCSLPENREPEESDWKTCYSKFFLQEVFIIQPSVIVCLGNDVYNIVVELEELSGFNIQKVFHHAYISRDASKYQDWKEQWERILRK